MADNGTVKGFLAVRMPASVRKRLESVSEELRAAGVSGDWQRRGTHHLTLKYVGEIGSEEFDDIAEALREPCGRLSLPEFSVGPLFTFENDEGQTILAARVEPKEDLQRLFRVLERVTVACGGPESEFPSFKPHVTLCYLDEDGEAAWKDAKGQLDLPESFGEMSIASVPLNEGGGAGSDFKVRRLVRVGGPASSRYHAAMRLLASPASPRTNHGQDVPAGPARSQRHPVATAGRRHDVHMHGLRRGGVRRRGAADDKPYCGDCYDDKLAICDDCGGELEKGATGTTEMPSGDWYCRDCEPHVCAECEKPITRGEEHDCDDNTLCEGCFEEQCAACVSCDKVGFTEGMVHALDEWFCEQHAPAACDSCGEYLSEDYTYYLSDGTYCEDCYSDQRMEQVKELWSEFYEDNPDLEGIDALSKAVEGADAMAPDIYIRIFGDLDWRSDYGGDAWAGIAETWRDLKAAVEGKDWGKTHLLVDHAFDLVHNTGSLFTKASPDVQKWLFQALEEKYFLDPLQYRGKLSNDVRKLLDLHIRYSGGVAKWKERMVDQREAMDKFTRAFREHDGRMAKRVWDTFGLKEEMFRGRDDFLDAAYWSQRPEGYEASRVAKLREFLAAPSRERFLGALAAVDVGMCEPGSPHPASRVVRDEFVPKAMRLLETDEGFRRMMEQARLGKGSIHREPLLPFYQMDAVKAWDSLFRARKRRQREEAKGAKELLATALRFAFLRVALSRTDFYDFYALSLVECGKLPDDVAGMCEGLRRITTLDVAKALLMILERAVVREARHVDHALALEGE